MSADKKPASVFGDELESLNPDEWTPHPSSNDKASVDPDAVREAAEQAGFTSREPVQRAETSNKGSGKKKRGRPHSKEPTDQINIRAKLSVIEDFRGFSESREPEWPLGYTLERALAALKRELKG